MSAPRLSAATFEVPYDRSASPTIAHLGVGAFARAHLGAYADDLLRAGWPATIRGVSLRSRRADDQLTPQNGLYTLLEREPGEPSGGTRGWKPRPSSSSDLRVLGAFTDVATGREAAVEAIADPNVALVTLTVTEKAYAVDEVPAVVAQGLARRDREQPLVVASLDNVLDNGALLRERVLEAAAGLDGDPARWIADSVAFPTSVVDRMVPATTPDDLDEVERALGLHDEAAVVAEHHCSWVLEDVDGLPPLADVGVQVVTDVGPYQRRKLWLLNLPHSALAYGGMLAGCGTIAEAADHPVVAPFVDRLVDDVLEVADLPDARAFAADARHRFRNPALGHTCAQVGADGSQKLRQRLLPVVEARRRAGRPTDRFALVVAGWRAAGLEDPAPDDQLGDDPFVEESRAAGERLQREGVDVLREAT